MIELTERLVDAERYEGADMHPMEQANCRGMIDAWQRNMMHPSWPSFRAQTLPMRQVARILRGEATYPAGSIPGALTPVCGQPGVICDGCPPDCIGELTPIESEDA
jgi:hypothetical protein